MAQTPVPGSLFRFFFVIIIVLWCPQWYLQIGARELTRPILYLPLFVVPVSGSAFYGACNGTTSSVRERQLQVKAPGCICNVGISQASLFIRTSTCRNECLLCAKLRVVGLFEQGGGVVYCPVLGFPIWYPVYR